MTELHRRYVSVSHPFFFPLVSDASFHSISMYSASALAGNTMVRSAISAAFPLFTHQGLFSHLFDENNEALIRISQLGINWSGSLVGFIGLALAPSAFLFYLYGARIRMFSKFAPYIVSLSRSSIDHWLTRHFFRILR
jgi:hypothetical protein